MCAFFDVSAEKAKTVVLQIARSAGWGGQKAVPTTSNLHLGRKLPGGPHPIRRVSHVFPAEYKKQSLTELIQHKCGQEPRGSLQRSDVDYLSIW